MRHIFQAFAPRHNNAGFTLVELLIVVGVLAILATGVVIVINPGELFAQSRDSKRLQDLKTIEKAVNLSVVAGGDDQSVYGDIYISLPDTDGDGLCNEYTLPSVSGWTYRCRADVSTLQNIDGTGWVPIDFTVATIDPPLAMLPIDPQNDEEHYYVYAVDSVPGEYSVLAALESQKYEPLAGGDGGTNPQFYETSPPGFTFDVGSAWETRAIAYGPKAAYNPAVTTDISTARLTDSTFVAVYKDSNGTAVIGAVSGDSVSYGAPVDFNPDNTDQISVAALDNSRFVVVYRDGGNSNYGTAVIGTVSGNSISFGSEAVFHSGRAAFNNVAALDADHFAVIFHHYDAPAYTAAVIGTVSGGDTIAFGAETQFATGSSSYSSIAAVDPSTVVVVYSDVENARYGTALVGSVSGNTIAFNGSKTVFNNVWTSRIDTVAIDSSRVLIAYESDPVGTDYGMVTVGTVTGNEIAFDPGSALAFNTASSYVSIDKIDPTHFVVAYSDTDNSNYGTAVIGEVSGTTLNYGSEHIFLHAYTTFTATSALAADTFVAAFVDYSESRAGTSIVGVPQ